ncbi:MAG: ribbon-helix-helix domain-containing protein [Dehalococcoidia bacterium]
MARMVRKQVYIDAEQDALLKRRAKELGVTESELIRRGIDLADRTGARTARDRTAWEEELAFLRKRSRIPARGRARGWTREELYEERIERLSR